MFRFNNESIEIIYSRFKRKAKKDKDRQISGMKLQLEDSFQASFIERFMFTNTNIPRHFQSNFNAKWINEINTRLKVRECCSNQKVKLVMKNHTTNNTYALLFNTELLTTKVYLLP